ncbi:MFS transporter [Aureibaculum marinum]|uniref:MFS transporter n=1 Tax=Aureibaculum marinum TaxID=2487930 RepID=A0A3N4NF07_9FLAO|nr:MFS transporter [Aureibaculum marinum]
MNNHKQSPKRKSLILAALMTTMALAAMDSTIVATAIPQIVGDLGGFSLFSWLFSIYLLIQTITIPIYGKLADIYGRKPILIYGVIVFLLGSAACAGAWNMVSLIIFRGVQAVGAGAMVATINTIAADIYTIEERAKIQGWLSSVWGVSALIGPAIGGALADYVSWRWIFLINLPVGIGSITMISLFLKEKKSVKYTEIDWLGASALLITGAFIMFGMMEGGKLWDWMSYQTLIFISIALLLIVVTRKIEGAAKNPIIPKWVWKKRVLVGANLATIGMGCMTMGPSMFLPVFAQSILGVGAIVAGFILASMSVTWPLSSSLSGKLYLRIGFRNTALCGISIVITAVLIFLFVPFPSSIWTLVGIQLLMGAGFGLISTPLMVGVQSTVKWGQRGVVTGASMFSRYFGQSLGAAIFATIFNSKLFEKLTNAPENLKNDLPRVNEVVEVLQSADADASIQNYLQHSFFDATHLVYIGLLLLGLFTLTVLLITPKDFPSIDEF